MRTLLAGVVGAAVATAVWLCLEHTLPEINLSWLACLVGVVTGLSVRRGSGAVNGESIVRGALAIVLTLSGIVGGRFGYAKYMEATTEPAGIVVNTEVEDEPATEESEDADATAAEETAPVLPAADLTGLSAGAGQFSPSKKPSMKNTFSEWDTLWMSLAALGAYVTGKGGGKGPATEAVADEPSDDKPDGDQSESA